MRTINSYVYLPGLIVDQRMVPWTKVLFGLIWVKIGSCLRSSDIISEEKKLSKNFEFFGIKSSEVRAVGGGS